MKRYSSAADFSNLNINEKRWFFLEIYDIHEELGMTESVLSQQEEVWRDFVFGIWPDLWRESPDGRFGPTQALLNRVDAGAETWKAIPKPHTQFKKYKRRIQTIKNKARRVEKIIAATLDLKQKHASMKEAHATAVMSASVFGFTVVTIIFAHLSFIVALFALPIDRFQRQQVNSIFSAETGAYKYHYIATWAGELNPGHEIRERD